MSKLYGEHAVRALLNTHHTEDACIFVEQSKQKNYHNLFSKAEKLGISIRRVPHLNDLFPQVRHQGIGATFKFQFGSLMDLNHFNFHTLKDWHIKKHCWRLLLERIYNLSILIPYIHGGTLIKEVLKEVMQIKEWRF